MKYQRGQNVWVIGQLEGEQYKGFLGKVTSVREHLTYAYMVLFANGEQNAFREDELAPADVRVIEGNVGMTSGFEYLTIGGEYIGLPFRDLLGKNVHITIVVREDAR
jgi:hypothetical protein